MSARAPSAAFEALVRAQQDRLYRYGRAVGLDHDTTLDLVQDAFLRAHARWDQCREAERAGAWLFRIFRNLLLDWAKDLRRGLEPLPEDDVLADTRDEAEHVALRATVGAALAALSPALREAVLLRDDLGHDYEEIAAIAGISLSAAKMRVQRGREALRARLAPDYGHVTGAAARSS